MYLETPEAKHKEDVFLERCLGEIRESSKHFIDSLKVSEEMKMILLMSMQKTIEELVKKI